MKKISMIILVAGILRLILAKLPGFAIDTEAWFAWALRLAELGSRNFYSSDVWTNYTPGFLYVLNLLGLVQKFFNLSEAQFYFILKLPAILADLWLIYFVYIEAKNSKLAKWLVLLVAFNPVLMFNSAIWGQVDSILTLTMVMAVYFLQKKEDVKSGFFYGLALLIKPQAVAIAPIFLLYYLKQKEFKSLVITIVVSCVVLIIGAVPFFANPLNLFGLILKMSSDYPANSLFAYNFWGVFGFWINDSKLFFDLSWNYIGYILFAAYWLVVSAVYFRKRISLYALCALATLGFYFLPTRVHERYLYPAIIFLILTLIEYKSKKMLLLTVLLSLTHLINLYFVYVYYNEVYLKLPKILYQQNIYQFLENNGNIISLFSSFIFVLISINILRNAKVKH